MEINDLPQGVEFSHRLIQEHLSPGEVAVDATCGNGHDTLFLSKLVGEKGKVIAFDIQEKAVKNTKSKLQNKGLLERAEVILDGHQNMEEYLQNKYSPQAIIFNLGYLPGSDKEIITTADNTITALNSGLKLLKKGGLIVLVIYVGHQGGLAEKEALLDYASSLNESTYNVLYYHFINQKNNPPELIAIKKR